MKKTIYIVALLALAGCSKPETPAHLPPVTIEDLGGVPMTVKELKALYRGSTTVVEAPDAVVSGKVISTDQYGNFYRSFFIQDETSGIEVKVGIRNGIYHTYHVGQTILIKPQHLVLGAYGNMVSLGYVSDDPKYENAWMDAPLVIARSVYRGTLGAPATPAEISAGSQITDDMYGTLVKFTGATYVSGNMATWARPNDPSTPEDDSAYGEQTFTLSDGVQVVVRTSGYAKFAATPVPFSPGATVDLTGVLTKFNATIQLVLNTDADVVQQ